MSPTCPRCGKAMHQRPDETHAEFVRRWESDPCPESDYSA